ncbi:hypothetical protein CYMTET_48080 [Cymbomonas tetramitiformis]|uniref:Uncharacterized protein n=1 Tax=Cymbomonas tetramitiformis TaxID=36881 RepID=A0AAE0BUK4_9CHLO|nr:hypothetical protein CYMTET_48080 [Cymbomonas tetramitiformis]
MFIYLILPALIPLVYVLWAGAPDAFDHDDICKCPTLVSPLRTFCRYAYPPFPPQHPNVQPRVISSLAFKSMAASTRARKRLLRDSDLDASIRLLDAVRDTPTASTPPVVPPAASSNTDVAVALRKNRKSTNMQRLTRYTRGAYIGLGPRVSARISLVPRNIITVAPTTPTASPSWWCSFGPSFSPLGWTWPPLTSTTPPLWLSRRLMGSSMTSWPSVVMERNSVADTWLRGTDSSADRDGRRALIDIIKGSVPAALRESHQQEHAALRYPAGVDPQPVLAREQRLVRDNRAPDWRPTDETRKRSLYNHIDPIFYAAVKVRYPLAGREKQALGAGEKPSALITSSEYAVLLDEIAALKALVYRAIVWARFNGNNSKSRGVSSIREAIGWVCTRHRLTVGFDRDNMKAKPLCHRCRKAGKGDTYHAYRDCPLGGRQHSSSTAAAFCIPIEEEDAEGLHTLALVQVFQEAADDGPEAFARAASAYGPPAVLSAGGVGGIDVSAYGFSVQPAADSVDDEDILRRLDALTSEVQAAQDKVHFTHASFIPGSGAEGHASALVCGPAATVGIIPEGQVPAGGAAASASAVPAPAMPVSQVGGGGPTPTQSARVTTTEATCGEFGGFVHTVNHAAVRPSDLTGYDTDGYEDFADGAFAVKPRAPAGAVGCDVPPFGFGKPAIGRSRYDMSQY